MIDGLCAEIAARWPGLTVERASLEAALDERGLEADHVNAVDVGLALALAAGDPVALTVFDREICNDVRGALMRVGRDDDLVEEALQQVRVKLLVGGGEPARILTYRGKGPLAAWIQIIAIREILMAHRQTRRESGGDDELLHLAATEPQLARARQGYRDAFAAAFRRAMAELDQRARTVLRLTFIDGVGTEALARFYGVHRVTAFRWLRDAREALLSRTREHFLTSADLTPSDVDSIMRSLAESLSVSW